MFLVPRVADPDQGVLVGFGSGFQNIKIYRPKAKYHIDISIIWTFMSE